ncbi:MAG: DinB family protein [Acidobacteriota bacterium]
MVRVDTVLESWRSVRADAAAAVREWPEAEMGFRATPELMTYGEIARHILNAGHGLTGILLSGETDFQTPDFRAKLAGYSSGLKDDAAAGELADAMEQMAAERIEALRGQTAEWWSVVVRKWDGQELTRLEYIQFVKEHELTHRSQLFLYMRLMGLVPPTTRRRLAKK